MKLSSALLFICAFSALATPVASQNARVNINGKNLTVSSFINQIEEQTDYLFIYSKNEIDVNENVDVQSGSKEVSACLKEAFGNSDVNYQFDKDYIILTKDETDAPQDVPLKKNVTGKIIDAVTGEPVIGAAVMIKGTGEGAVSNLDGCYSIAVPADAVLTISSIGYSSKDVKVEGKTTVNIALDQDVLGLEETVVIAYGTAKRKDFTGSVSSIRMETSPVGLVSNDNAMESLKGSITGLDISGTSSSGEEPTLLIRGQKSISGSNEPLVVVDGVIFMGSINDINPNDIETIDVLKDATSAAAYGSRSANGVIMITTKRGRSDKPVITFNATAGVQGWLNKPQLRDSESQVKARLEKAGDVGIDAVMTTQELNNYNAGNVVDWVDMATRVGSKQDYQLSLSGAAKRVNYYLSTAYTDSKGIVKGDDFGRISVMGKMSADVTDWLNIGVNASFARQDYSGKSANMTWAYNLSPFGQATRANSDEMEKYPEVLNSIGKTHPLWDMDETRSTNTAIKNNYKLNASALVKCPWIDGLSYRLTYSISDARTDYADFYHESYYVIEGNYDDESRYTASANQSHLGSAYGSIVNCGATSWVMDNILNYNKDFNKHSIDLTAVATRDSYSYFDNTFTGRDFAENGNTSLGIYGLQAATVKEIKQNELKKTNIGYMARGMYSYDSRYFLTASYRRDGSSVFGANKKWGNFMSVGGAWKISNEKFYSASLKNVLTDLKIKLSWGKNGNQGLNPYETLSEVVYGKTASLMYEFAGNDINYGIKATTLGNGNLGWETTSAWNFGFESNWFNGRLMLDVDGYVSDTRDQIFERTIPAMTGYTKMYSSIGHIRNYGMELTARSVNIRRGDFTWMTGLTFWLPRNVLMSLYGEDNDGDGKEDDDLSNGYFIGKPLGAIFGYKQDGVCQVTDTEYIEKYGGKPGYPKYVDINDDGKIDTDDRQIVGYNNYNYRLNLSNTFTYKNLELYFMLTGTFGGDGYYLASNKPAYALDFSMRTDIPWWTEENASNKYLSPRFINDNKFLGLQSRDFVRLQDITLSYNFNGAWLKNNNISGLKLFLTGKNLFTLTKWEGEDPETGTTALSPYPMSRVGTIGVNLVF